MSNCPACGRTPSPPERPTCSSSSVHVSSVSRVRETTRYGTGTMAPRPGASTDADAAIHVQEPHPRVLQPVDHHLREPAHQLVAELLVVFTLAAQARAVERDRAHRRV